MLKNAALKQIIGMELQSLTTNKAYQLKIFQYASHHDFGNST
jgi:hypothetical protein